LRLTFFAPGVDSDALSDAPALAHHERLAYPCCCRQATASSPPLLLRGTVVTPTKKHPLANNVQAQGSAGLYQHATCCDGF
jgi:hypothetical protein